VKILIIGAGFSGSVVARSIVDAHEEVEAEVWERRDHIGGNCYDSYDENGVLVHRYGPHYFRTNHLRVLQFLSGFTEWISGDYRVNASIHGREYPMPISLATISAMKGHLYSEDEFRKYLDKEALKISDPQNAEEAWLSTVGRELYETFYKGYTIKQWGTTPAEMAPYICERAPLRFNFDMRYVSDAFQVMPKAGYTKLFAKMLSHPRIKVVLKHHFKKEMAAPSGAHAVIYTGPVDKYFDYQPGELRYRSLEFTYKHFSDRSFYQDVVQVNYPNEFEYTRIVESKHVTKQSVKGTTICLEFSRAQGEPFYPIPDIDSSQLADQYRRLAKQQENKTIPIFFTGRLAEYCYYNMDEVILNALKLVQEKIMPLVEAKFG